MESGLLHNLIIPILTGAGGASGVLLGYFKFFREGKKDSQTFDQEEREKYKIANEEMRKQVEALTIAYLPSSVPEWIKDSHRKYVYVSPSYERDMLLRLGLTRNDLIGRNDTEIFSDYPDYVRIIKSIEDEARISKSYLTIRHNVIFPANPDQFMVIKEITQNMGGDTFYRGRAFPEELVSCKTK